MLHFQRSNFKASLIVPMGHKGPAFLVYRNFDVIMGWNRSILYALSVAHLSDRLNGAGRLSAKPLDEAASEQRRYHANPKYAQSARL